MQLFPVGKTYDFMRWGRLCSALSLLLILGSIALMFYPGPQLGTDFKGGTEIEVAFLSDVGEEAIREAVSTSGFSQPDVIRVRDADNAQRFLIRVQEVSSIAEREQLIIENALCFGDALDAERCPEERQAAEVKFSPGGDKITVRYRSEPDLDAIRKVIQAGPGGIVLREGGNNPSLQNPREHRVEIQLKGRGDQLMDGLRAALGSEVVPEFPLRVEWVGPKAGAQLRDAAIQSIAIALLFMMVYIAVRFDLRFAPGAVVALAHDAIATTGILILLDREITLTTVAALLTIIGYSINDTVVIYDRVRENLVKLRGTGFTKIINISLSETLSRTLVTSGTTIISLLAFTYWGTAALRDFAQTLIIGMVLGVYSTIFIALQLTHWLDQKVFAKTALSDRAPKGPRVKKESAVV